MQAQPFNAMKSGGKGDGRKADARPAAPVQKPKATAWTIDFDEEPTETPAFPISERPPSGQTSSFKFFHARGKAAPQIVEVEALPDPRPFENGVDEVEADRPQPGRPSAPAKGPGGANPGRGSRFRSPGGRPPAAAAAEDSEEAAQPTFSFVRSGASRETIGRAEPDVSARSAGTSVGYASGRSSEGLSSCYSAESGRASPAVQWEIPADGDSSALPSSAARRGPPKRPPREAKPVEVGRPPAEKPQSRPSSAAGSALAATRPAAAAPVVAEGGGAPPQGLLPEGRRQEMEYKRMLIEARQRELAIAQREEELRQEAQRLEELRANTVTQPPKASPYAAAIEPVSPVFVAHCQAQSRTRSPPVTHPAGSSPVHFLDFGSAAPTPARASLSPLHTSPVEPGRGGSHAAAAECPPSPDASVQAVLAAQAEAKRKAALKKQREEQKRREEEDRKREEERAWEEAQQKMEEMARKKEEQRRYEAERRRKAEERKQEEKVRLEEARRQEEERKEAEKAQRQEQVRLAAERRREEEKQRARQKRMEEEKRKAKAVKDEEVYRQSPPKGTRAHPISPAVQDPMTGQWCTGSPVPVRRQTSPDATLSRSKSPPARPRSQPTSPAPETKSAARRSSTTKPYAVASPYAVESPFGAPVSKPAQASVAAPPPKVSKEIAFQTSAFASAGPPARASRARSPPPRPSAPTAAAAAAVAPAAPPRARSAEPRPVMLKMKGAKASKGESLCNLSVCVRFRPPPPRSEALEVAWVGEGNTVSMAQARPERITNEKAVFAFENVFLEDENTFEVYDHMCRSAVEGAVRGTNSTIFAYGQTNSGKTYTIGGGDGTPGVIELAAQNIFQQIAEEQAAAGPGCSFKVSSSYVEIYNEQLSDLMRPPKQRRNHQLTILDGPMGVVVDNLLLLPVETEEQVIGLKRKGESYRHVDSNNEHAYASRSHTIFQFHIERTDVLGAGGPTMTKSVLNVVDLAGSEATYLPFKTEGRHHYDPLDRDVPSSFGVDRATAQRKHDFQKQNKEGNNIRCSLLALMRVVRALATRIKSGDQAIHIPYRDSKLTRMLSDAVGGNSETVLICTMNPLEYRETLSTLHFAALAQQVRGTPKPVTMSLSSNEALQQYRGELEKMRALLESEKQRQADLSTQCEEQEREETQQVQYVHVVQELDEEQREAIIAEERERFAQELEVERQRHQQEMQQAVHRLRSASAQLEFEQLKREESVRELGQRLAEAEKEIEQERRRPSIPPSEHEAAVAKQKEAQAKVEELQQQWSTKAEELESLQREQAQLHANAKSLQDGLQKVAQEREAMMQYIKYKQEKGEKGLGNFFRKVFGKSKLDPQPWERFMPARPPTVVAPSAVPSTAPPGPAAPKAPKPAAAPPPAPPTQPVKPPPLQLPPHNFVGPSPSGSDVASSAADSDAGSSDGFERVLYPDAAPSPVKAQAFAGGRGRSPPGAFRRSHSTPSMDPYPSGPPVERPMDRYSYARSPPSQRGEPSARRHSPQGPRYFPQQRHSCDFSARDADIEAEARPSSRQAFPQYSGGRRPPQETPSPVRHRTPTSGYRGPPRRSLTYNRFDDRLPNPRHSSDASFEDFDRMLR